MITKNITVMFSAQRDKLFVLNDNLDIRGYRFIMKELSEKYLSIKPHDRLYQTFTVNLFII